MTTKACVCALAMLIAPRVSAQSSSWTSTDVGAVTIAGSTTEANGHRHRRHHDQAAEHREHPAPAQEIADQAGGGRAQQIAGHGAGQRAADGDLAPFRPDQIAGQTECHRKYPARADAGKNPRREQ